MSPEQRPGRTSRIRAPVPLAIVVALAACAPVPNLGPRPALHTPASIDAAETVRPRGDADWPGDGWWSGFGDPQLTALIDAGLAVSPDVLLAAARVRRAEAMVQQAGAVRRPALNADAEGGVRKQSANNGFPKQFLPEGWQDNGQLSVSFGYDLDLWGKNRAALTAATSEARAAAIDAAQARLILTTGIAQAYFELDRLYRQRDLAVAAQENRQAARGLAQRADPAGRAWRSKNDSSG